MNGKLIALCSLLTLVMGCSSMKVNNDYDHQADFSSYKTYAWHESDQSLEDTNPLAHERLVSAVDGQLSAKGFQKVSSNPDVFVTYHTDEDQQMSLNTSYMGGGWGAGPGWGWGGGMGSSTTTVQKYNVGSVVLDMWDAKQKRLVWRGTASDTISDNPQKNAEKITKATQKLFESYPPAGG